MRCCFHSSVFCYLLAWQLLSVGALSPRRRRCSVDLQRDSRVLATAFFDGVILWHCGTIRFVSKRLFLPTFSGKPEKVCRRRHGCDVAAFNSSPVQTGKWPDIRPAILPILRRAGRRRLPAGPPSRGGPAGARECAADAEPPPCGRRPTVPVRRRSAPAPAPLPTRRHSF